ncbi:hypothetical protein [Pontibacter actiniarum]|uniref:Uncharacterized protein n=1 Tax=Pontibacter actiniarum TaxID=323450 RepID=A0A1X9YT81_9BACT|nr:hypothetical protein [Pontibacter actiniarum]ARS36089.1 hypothetical protein CA264_11970 [Pontibacter actiniarum]
MNKNLKLSDIPKRNPYQVPEGYFDRLPMRVMEQTASREKPAWQQVLWRPVRLATAPLALLLLLAGVYVANLPEQPEQQLVNLAAVSDTDIVQYLSTYATLETTDFEELSTLREQELPAELLNVSATAAEEELEYYTLDDIEY